MKGLRKSYLILLLCNPIAALGRQSIRARETQADPVMKEQILSSESPKIQYMAQMKQHDPQQNKRDLAMFFISDSLICPTGAELDLLCDDVADTNLLVRTKRKRTMRVMMGKKKRTTRMKRMMKKEKMKKKMMKMEKMKKKMMKKMNPPPAASSKVATSGKGMMGHMMHSKGKAGSTKSQIDQDSSRSHVSSSSSKDNFTSDSSKGNPIVGSSPTQTMMNRNPPPAPISQGMMMNLNPPPAPISQGMSSQSSSKVGTGSSKGGKGSSKGGKGSSKGGKGSSKGGKGSSKGGKGSSKGGKGSSKSKSKRRLDVSRNLGEGMEVDPLVDGFRPTMKVNSNDDDCDDDDSIADLPNNDDSTDDDSIDDDSVDDDSVDDDSIDDDFTDDDATDDDETDDSTDDTATTDSVEDNSINDLISLVTANEDQDDENYLDDLMQKCCVANPDTLETGTPTFGPTTDFFAREPIPPTVADPIDACPAAYVYCPGKSMCFLDSAFNGGNPASDWGFNIMFDSGATGTSTLDNCQIWTGVKGCDLSTGKMVGTATVSNELFHITLKLGQYESNSFQLYAGKCVASDGGIHLQNGGVCQSSAVSVFANKVDKFPIVADSRSYKSTHTFDANAIKNTVDWPGYRVFPLGTEGRNFLVGHMRVCPVEFTFTPTLAPTLNPTSAPTLNPISAPTLNPISAPTLNPIAAPILSPLSAPTSNPVSAPTLCPLSKPTTAPISPPTLAPAKNTSSPTTLFVPDGTPSPTTNVPILKPTAKPFSFPTIVPATASPVLTTAAPHVFCETSPPESNPTASPKQTTSTPVKSKVVTLAPKTVAPTQTPTILFVPDGTPSPSTNVPTADIRCPDAPVAVPLLAPNAAPVAPFTVSPLAPTVAPVAPFTVSPLAPTVVPVAPFTVSPLAPTVVPVAPFTVSPLAPTVAPVAPFTVSPLAPTVAPVAPFTVSPLAPTVVPVAPFTVSPLAPTLAPVAPATIPNATSIKTCESAFVYCPGRSVCLSNVTGNADAVGWSIKYNATEGTVDNCEIYTGVQPGCNISKAKVVGKFTIMPTLVHYCLDMGEYVSNSFQLFAGSCPANDNAAHFREGSVTCKLSDMMLYGDQYKTFPLVSAVNQTFVDSYIFDNSSTTSSTWGNYKVFNIGTAFRGFLSAHTLLCPLSPAPEGPFGEEGTPVPSIAAPASLQPISASPVSLAPLTIAPVTRMPSSPPKSAAPVPVAATSVAPIPVAATTVSPTRIPTLSPKSAAPVPAAAISVAPVPVSATAVSPTQNLTSTPTRIPTLSPATSAPVSTATASPTTVPTSNFNESECVTAFAMCDSPMQSVCFEDLHPEDKLFGWSVIYDQAFGQLDNCTLYAGIPSFGCDLSKAIRVGSVSIQPDNVTYTLIPGVYESNTFSMYAGKCRGNEEGEVLTNGGFCNVEKICDFADAVATYPLQSAGGPKVNTFTFDKNSSISQPWPSNYTVFPVGREFRQFLSIHATVCTIDGKFPF